MKLWLKLSLLVLMAGLVVETWGMSEEEFDEDGDEVPLFV